MNNIGLVGLATMGANLARNIERNGYTISVFNRTTETMEKFIADFGGEGTGFTGCATMEEFVASLEAPRKIILLVKAGKPVDLTIEALLPHLEQGDIIIDGGNSHFPDTIRRTEELEAKGIRFMGIGVSGGEEGALMGPSMMPGGTEEAWGEVKDILQKIAAKAPDGEPCCDYVGPNGAGHYVKMVHNGIEYGDMQLISETYFMLKHLLGLSNAKMADIFAKWNEGKLKSFLIEIAADVLRKKDDQGDGDLIDAVLDKSGQKGTGKWTAIHALELGIPLPTVTSAVYERCISAFKEERVEASKIYDSAIPPYEGDKQAFIDALENALFAAKISTYAQGMFLISEASKEHEWNINLGNTAKLWRAGCIIRAQILQNITEAYKNDSSLSNLLLDPSFQTFIKDNEAAWREVVYTALKSGVSVPAFASTLTYFDSYRTARLPANMIQSLRDYFGAHTYERLDKEGSFHSEWGQN